ncbi:TetR family transcriptional regulator [Kitasatospora sp. NPDC008115]|uniref:TetR family transcriptional regulator n=1 Tax=Kitasatospora sp. NPDC008115 TaxID=3364022 RepID=UPI0036F0C926
MNGPMRADTTSHPATGRTGTGRRRPVQQRSQERYERILDACAALLDEAGAAALTTKEVAQRAQVPIGTLYQFFAGKEDLLAALAGRNLDHYLHRLDDRLRSEAPDGPDGFTDLAVEEFVAMKRTVPGFGQMDFGSQVDFGLGGAAVPNDDGSGSGDGNGDGSGRYLLDSEVDNNTAVALRLQALGGELFFAAADPAALTLGLRVALEAADAVLKLAFRGDPQGDPTMIAECKRLVRCYLVEQFGRP